MKNIYFDFSFTNWLSLLLALLPALINFGIFVYVLMFIKRTALSATFLPFLFTLIMWRMQDVVLQICVTRECAEMWYRMFSIFTNFIGATGLHFVLTLINNKKWKQKNYHILALYLPTFFFSMFFASGVEYMSFKHTENWGWVYIPSHPVSIAAFILIGVHASLMIILLSIHTWKLKKAHSVQYKRARIILAGSSAPIIVGCMYQIVLPLFFNYTPVLLASSLGIFFSLAIFVAFKKYNFLEYSPFHQWANIVENMNEGILIVDNRDIIQYVNSKFCEMLGYSNAELLNKCTRDIFVLPEHNTLVNKMVERRKKLFRDQYEMEIKKKDGRHIVCEINAQPYLDYENKVVGSVGIHTDVTEKREIEKKIKESESRYRSFVEQATDGIFVSDQFGNYLEVNTKACQMVGYSKAELLTMNINDLLFGGGDTPQGNPPKSCLMLSPQGKSFLAVRTLKRKDGSAIPTEINARMLPDKNILSIVRDITERKKAEEELLEKVKEMDTFIYRASHDLRGPLASVAGLTNLGKEDIKDTQAAFYFDKIHESITRLDDILIELNKIARVTQAKLEPVEIDLKKEVDHILESLKHLPGFSSIEFITEINIPSLLGDRILLILVLQNLIINSINYFDEEKEKLFIRIQAYKIKAGIEIVLSDNGVGIPESIQEKVFEMFYRGTDTSKGSGLGLYIVKNALKKLNGTIHLSSIEGEGTTFTIKLPKAGLIKP